MNSRLLRLAALGSQLINVVVCNGSPDETISGRAWRQGELLGSVRWGRVRRVIDRAFFFQEGHCEKSHHQDVLFARSVMELYRK